MSEASSAGHAEQPLDVVLCATGEAVVRLESIICHLCVGLVDLNARVRLITSPHHVASFASLGPLEVLAHAEGLRPLRRLRKDEVLQPLTSRPPSVIYAISSESYGLAARLAQALDVELVLGVTARRDVDALDDLAIRHAGPFIVASEPLRPLLLNRGDVTEARVTLIRPGVPRGSGPTCFSDPDAVPSLSCTAAFDFRSGVELVVQAGALLRDRGCSLMTFLLGTGPREASLRKLIRSLNQSANVVFAAPSADIIEVLRGSDIYVLPPGDDEISARPLQAMTSGTAIVCFSGGVFDCFHDGETAVVCDEHTPEALAQAIESLMRDHNLARALASRANEYVRKHHRMSAMAEQTFATLQMVALPGRTFKLNPD